MLKKAKVEGSGTGHSVVPLELPAASSATQVLPVSIATTDRDLLILLYWVIGVDGTSFEASGYMFDGDRVLPIRCA